LQEKEKFLWPGLVYAAVDLGKDLYNTAPIIPLITDHVGDPTALDFLVVSGLIMSKYSSP
jgi:hypothetical protein